jgi:regulator of CtrA degradation
MTQSIDHDAAIATPHDPVLYRALVAGLYSDALVLADEARAWFDGAGPAGAWQAGNPSPLAQVALGCESLRVTLRITHALSWLMTERARLADGGIGGGTSTQMAPAPTIANVPAPDAATLPLLPDSAVRLIRASERLLVRIDRLGARDQRPAATAPVHQLLDRLRAHY